MIDIPMISKCPGCGSDIEHVSFYKFHCPTCNIDWAITKITDSNRGYYKK